MAANEGSMCSGLRSPHRRYRAAYLFRPAISAVHLEKLDNFLKPGRWMFCTEQKRLGYALEHRQLVQCARNCVCHRIHQNRQRRYQIEQREPSPWIRRARPLQIQDFRFEDARGLTRATKRSHRLLSQELQTSCRECQRRASGTPNFHWSADSCKVQCIARRATPSCFSQH